MAKATARHILVDTEDRCQSLKDEISGGADFAELARKNIRRVRQDSAVAISVSSDRE